MPKWRRKTIMAERITGEAVHRIVTEQRLLSIREIPRGIGDLIKIESIIFVGSSCVGKSTLERAVRAASLEDPLLSRRVGIPQRVVTRPPRSDDGNDIYFCSQDEFTRLASAGELGLYGVKIMEGGRQEPYGYLQPEKGHLPIFFANNQTLKNRVTTQPEGILESALVILIYAPDYIREERLRARSPQLFEDSPDEVAFRLSREERAIGLAPNAHLIVKNYRKFASRSAEDTIGLIKGIVEVFNGRRC